jgi:hypothetical protein
MSSDREIYERVEGTVYGALDSIRQAKTASSVTIPMPLAIMLQSRDGHMQLIGMAKWADAGFPCVTMGHKFAAALLCTTASDEAVAMARPPFPAFLIEVPDGLLTIDSEQAGTSRITPIVTILVYRLDNDKTPEGWAWGYTAYSAGGLSVFRYGVRAAELLPPELDEILDGNRKWNDDRTPFSFDLTDTDNRTTVMIGRLIVNTCLAFSDPTNVAEK